MSIFNKISEQNLAKASAVYSGMVFGVFWIPLRALDEQGFSGIWATSMFNIAATVFVLPIIFSHWPRFFPGHGRFHFICIFSGLGFTLYTAAFVYTEVVSAVALFYLMPIWGFLFARIFARDRITPVRWFSMAFAFAGLWSILGQGNTIPIPHNIGDWMALCSGILWAGMALMILTDKEEKPVDFAAGFVFWSAVISVVGATLATRYGFEATPRWTNLWPQLWWLLPFALIVIVPAAVATVYGPSKLNPGIVGLLFMTEISVGVVTAALWAGEAFGPPQLIGVALITLAGVLETAWLYIGAKHQPGEIGKISGE